MLPRPHLTYRQRGQSQAISSHWQARKNAAQSHPQGGLFDVQSRQYSDPTYWWPKLHPAWLFYPNGQKWISLTPNLRTPLR